MKRRRPERDRSEQAAVEDRLQPVDEERELRTDGREPNASRRADGRRPECVLEVGDQIVDGFDADGQPHEVRRRSERRVAVEACVIFAGTSIRLSTPPSDSAS